MSLKEGAPLSGKVAVVTGATSGVGLSIALALAAAGADLALIGRRGGALRAVANKSTEFGAKTFCYQVDLLKSSEIKSLRRKLIRNFRGVDILVHSAGAIARSEVSKASLKDFDRQYQINLRAPFALTQLLLPTLTERKGQIVFINSSLGLAAAPAMSQYSATKHALKALADSLRAEVNSEGVRVLTVYPGQTATPMQAKLQKLQKKPYTPELLIQPRQIASTVVAALVAGAEAEVTDIHIRPTIKPA